MFNSILLALSVSIDSLGIGITYGIKNVKFYFWSKCILFAVSIIFTSCAFFFGSFIKSIILSEILAKIISSIILVIIGIIILSDPIPFDFNNLRKISIKESIFIGIVLSLDSIGIGIGSSIGGYLNFYFTILASVFQITFISIGYLLGKKIIKITKIPDKICSQISASVIIIFAIIQFVI